MLTQADPSRQLKHDGWVGVGVGVGRPLKTSDKSIVKLSLILNSIIEGGTVKEPTVTLIVISLLRFVAGTPLKQASAKEPSLAAQYGQNIIYMG